MTGTKVSKNNHILTSKISIKDPTVSDLGLYEKKKEKHYNLISTPPLVSKAYSFPSKIAGKCYVTSEGKSNCLSWIMGLFLVLHISRIFTFPFHSHYTNQRAFYFFTSALIIGPLNIPLPQGALSGTGRLLQN